MNVQLQTIPQLQTEPIQPQFNIPRWNLALRIAFRFWMVYLGLYCLVTQIISTLFSIPGSVSRIASRSGRSLAAAPRNLLDRRPYFPRKCAPDRLLGRQQQQRRLHFRLGHGLLRACGFHCRDRRLVTSRPPPGELR